MQRHKDLLVPSITAGDHDSSTANPVRRGEPSARWKITAWQGRMPKTLLSTKYSRLRGPSPPSPISIYPPVSPLPHSFCRWGLFHTAEVQAAGISMGKTPRQTHGLALHVHQSTCTEQIPGVQSFVQDQPSLSFSVKKRKQNMGNWEIDCSPKTQLILLTASPFWR